MEQEITAETCRSILQEQEKQEREKQNANVYRGGRPYATLDDVLKGCKQAAEWGYSSHTLDAYLKWSAIQEFVKKGFTYYVGDSYSLLAWDNHDYYKRTCLLEVDSEEVYNEYFKGLALRQSKLQQIDKPTWDKLDKQVNKVIKYFNRIFS